MDGKVLTPPRAEERPWSDVVCGVRIEDPYRWLQDRDDPAVREYVRAENAYADSVMEGMSGLCGELRSEIRGRMREDESTAPVREGDWDYYDRFVEGKAYPIKCRRRAGGGPEEVILDQNALAEGRSFCAVSSVRVSADGRRMLYGVDFSGDELYDVRCVDLASGREIDCGVAGVSGDFEWASDGRRFFYTALDDARRPFQLLLHTVGSDPERDVRLFSEEDCEYGLYISPSLSRRFLFVILMANDSCHSGFIPLDDPEADVRFLSPKVKGVEAFPFHAAGRFYLRTNEDAPNFRIDESPDSGELSWRAVVPHSPDSFIDDFEAFDDFVALKERRGGELGVRILSSGFSEERAVELPCRFGSCEFEGNRSSSSGVLRFSCQSNVMPKAVYLWRFADGSLERIWSRSVPGYDPSLYETERIFAVSHDGERIPVTAVYRRDRFVRGQSPCLLMGYGAYGYSYDPEFSSPWISLMDRGFMCATAHVRGGQEMGRRWYTEGKLLKKRNTFLDFLACCDHLKSSGTVGKIAVYGRSAGGLLIGAVLTMRPGAFDLAAAEVPFVDALNTMLDESLPLTVGEFSEWGNPRVREYFDYIRSYSPYDNVRRTEYPPVYLYSAMNDSRVMYWEPLKFMARLRRDRTDSNVSILTLADCRGHFGASGRYDSIDEKARLFAFVISGLS